MMFVLLQRNMDFGQLCVIAKTQKSYEFAFHQNMNIYAKHKQICFLWLKP